MKTIIRNTLYIVLAVVLLQSCGYTEQTLIEFNTMKTPVILHDKHKITFFYSVTLRDGDNRLHEFGNLSSIARWMGDNYEKGDTIRHKTNNR